ncbi:MAG: ABC transporter permease [Marmoricola sp.]|nr:ABC transporter permease [Marmoricola sp.]
MILVELAKLVRRPRTWVTILALNALPTIVAVLLSVTDLGPRPGTGPPFLSAVLTDGTLFPLAALGIVLPLFLPVAVAVVGGDSIAGEVQSDTLRYLLVRPVARARLLVAKLVSIVAFVVLATLTVGLVAYLEGKLLLGQAVQAGTGGAAAGSIVSVSGSGLTQTQMAERTVMAFGYVILAMLGVAAIALLMSTLTDSAVGAALGTIAVLVASTVLLGLDAADSIKPYLITRYWLAFVDLFRDPIRWRDVTHGVLAQLSYLVVFAGAAWANFATKDINR